MIALTSFWNRARIALSRMRIPLTPLGRKTALAIGALILAALVIFLEATKGN